MKRPRRPRKPPRTTPAMRAPRAGEPWQLQTAKARFSELFRRARADGPQWVTRHETESVVVLPVEQYEQLTRRAQQPRSLVQFFAESPLAGAALDLDRPRDYGRDVDL
ncbi:MAG TPA: type II toxin-antitoxin system Phd/YefM family antitoxin [Gemmatimonadaceae bacterium]|jgi:antitoxin Phd|nr:type II toxin-antitoxin system Phd/YefM family antitoxin [Gemmatimonadaceae bacterium]